MTFIHPAGIITSDISHVTTQINYWRERNCCRECATNKGGQFDRKKQQINIRSFMKEIYINEKHSLNNSTLKKFCNAIIDPVTGKSLEFQHLKRDPNTRGIWNNSFANEFGRLVNGVGGRIKGTKTITFILKSMVPKWRKVTYGRIVVDYRTRFTVGGDCINYPGVMSTDTAKMLTVKLLLNSVVSTPRARCCILDIKDFYLNNLLPYFEHLHIQLKWIPEEIVQEYELNKITHNGCIYMQIKKGMYG